MAGVSFHFFEDTFNTLSSVLTSYIGDVSSSMIGAISGVTYTLLMIYVVLWGWTMLRGMISEPITDGLTRVIRLVVVITIAINIGYYNVFIRDFLWNTPDALASVVASGYSNSTSNVQYLDVLMGRMYDIGSAFWVKANTGVTPIPDFGLLIVAILVWVAGAAVTAYAAFLLILAKMGLAIVLAIGPLFVLGLLFEGTKRFFESWLAQALNFVFLVLLVAAGIKLILTIISLYLGVVEGAILANPTIDKTIPALILSLIGTLVLMQSQSIASSLGGGVAIGTLGAVGWAYGKAKAAAGATGNLASGQTLSNMRGARRSRAVNARWAANNPSLPARAAQMPMAVYRRISGADRNSVKRG